MWSLVSAGDWVCVAASLPAVCSAGIEEAGSADWSREMPLIAKSVGIVHSPCLAFGCTSSIVKTREK